MKKQILCVLLAYIGYQVSAQNLIPNASFDSLTKCPNTIMWLNSELSILPWFRPSPYSTPDNFNICSTEPDLGVPYNNQNFSHRTVHSGSGYAGISILASGKSPDAGSREYIETPLTKPMEKGQMYFIRFYVAPRRDSRYVGEMVYINSIGLNFTDTLFYTNALFAKLTPSIEHRGGVIKDTINWTPICGVYIANGGEKYATIGNFRSGAETIIEKENPIDAYYGVYYFLDDALVVPFNPLPDTLILCDNQTIMLNGSFMNAKYLWSTGSTDSVITINKAGTYIVQATIDGCTLTDQVIVLSTKTNDTLITDTSICKGQIITLKTNRLGKHVWSNGSNEPQIKVNTEGGVFGNSF